MDLDKSEPTRQQLLGFFAHPGTLSDYLALTKQCAETNRKETVLYHNLHSLYSYFTSAELRQHYSNTTVLVDGMPIIWLMQLFRIPVSREHRVTYVDFIRPLMQLASDHQWPVFHVGQTASIQETALDKLRYSVPGLNLSGHDGYFDQTPHSEESLAVVDQINRSGSKIVLIGFGAPRQEAWIHAHRELIEAPIVFSCGACMEYVAGNVRTPPRWMGRLGLEWSFRLMENPRRFAFRYLVEPIILACILCRNGLNQWVARKRA